MAGSRKDVDYVAGSGDSFAIQVDESNVELVMGGQVPLAISPNRKPSNLKTLRSVILRDITGNVQRTIPVLTEARYNILNSNTTFTLPDHDPDTGTIVKVVVKIPEKFVRLPVSFDTKKQDGDDT